MKERVYSSPQHKLLAFFHASRDRWRRRAKDYHQEIRRLEVRIRDVEASRDHWRAQYYRRPSQRPGDQGQEPAAGLEPPLRAWEPGALRA
jgi:hypothetical protein